ASASSTRSRPSPSSSSPSCARGGRRDPGAHRPETPSPPAPPASLTGSIGHGAPPRRRLAPSWPQHCILPPPAERSMKVEERCFGVPLTPEVRSLVRRVVERSFGRIETHVAEVWVRLFSVRDGVECRAVLRPYTGGTLALTETRPSTIEAV